MQLTTTTERDGAEGGFTLVELVIVMMLLGIVLAVLGNTLWTVQRSEAYTRGRTAALDDMRATLNRMTKDLRQTADLNGTPTASHLDVDTYVKGVAATVVYDVTGGALTRKVNGGTAKTLMTGLTTNNIFTYTPDASAPSIVSILLVVKPSNLPNTTLTLNSEIELRNRWAPT
jgi:prepilin-type N-terminal cleavage/methylation domain-containing protein